MSATKICSTSSQAFRSRQQAGELLAEQLKEYVAEDPVILGIPRGGIVISAIVAGQMNCQMDIVLTHKLGAPTNPELAIGAVAEDGHLILDDRLAAVTGAGPSYIEREKESQLELIRSRVERYRKIISKIDLAGRTAIITDDGIATGATMQAAVWAAKAERARQTIVAVPVAPGDSLEALAQEADKVICVRSPAYFGSIGRFYESFNQVSDQEVADILGTQAQRRKQNG